MSEFKCPQCESKNINKTLGFSNGEENYVIIKEDYAFSSDVPNIYFMIECFDCKQVTIYSGGTCEFSLPLTNVAKLKENH
jgi:hypothetical protein